MIMNSLLSNAVLATVLAVGVLAATRYWRRPPIVYWLWLLVLLKLVTPAVLPLPILVSAESEPTQQAVASLTLAEAEALLATLEDGAIGEVRGPAEPLVLSAPSTSPPVEAGASDATSVVETPVVVEPVSGLLDWRSIVASIWIAGSLLWILVAVVRVVRFGRLATQALPAPEWIEREAQQIAERFGMRRCPPIRLVAARIPPLVWAIHARPIVLLPSPLLTELKGEQLSALLAHELAHVRRGDHWVRRLELVVLAIYWWHPVAWLARRRLEEAEEQCCDAWVSWGRPAAARGYADALVRTVEFLSGPPRPAPLGASGIGPVRSLERRIQMILNERTPRRLSWKSALFVLAVSMLVLPWSAWAQDEPANDAAEEAVAEANHDPNDAGRESPEAAQPTTTPAGARDRGDPAEVRSSDEGPTTGAVMRDWYGRATRVVNRDVETQIKIFQLEEANAFEMQTLIQTLFEGRSLRVVSDARTNSVIVVASPPDVATIQALLQVLDAKVERPARQGTIEPPVLFPRNPGPIERPRTREGNSARGRTGDVLREPTDVGTAVHANEFPPTTRDEGEVQRDPREMLELLGGQPRAANMILQSEQTIRRLRQEIQKLKAQIDRMTKEAEAKDGTSELPPDLFGPAVPPASVEVPASPPELTLDDLFGGD